MRMYSLLFVLIALVMLLMFGVYLLRGPADPVIAGGLLVSFFACALPALYLLKPFGRPEDLERRREERRLRREERRKPR